MPQGPASIQHRRPQSHRLAAAERWPAHKNPAPIWFNWAELAGRNLQAFKQQKLKALCYRQLPDFRKKVHKLRPFVLLVRATCTRRGVRNCWNDTDSGKQKYWERNLSQCHCVHRRSHMDWHGNKSELPQWEAGDWPPEHGRAIRQQY